MKEIDELNLTIYKAESKELKILKSNLRRILKFINSEDLIKELRKRKVIINEWNDSKKKIELKKISKIN